MKFVSLWAWRSYENGTGNVTDSIFAAERLVVRRPSILRMALKPLAAFDRNDTVVRQRLELPIDDLIEIIGLRHAADFFDLGDLVRTGLDRVLFVVDPDGHAAL